MNTITLTHANTGQKICFAVAHLFYWYFSTAHQCTHLVSIAGALAPVRESIDEIERLYKQARLEEESRRVILNAQTLSKGEVVNGDEKTRN